MYWIFQSSRLEAALINGISGINKKKEKNKKIQNKGKKNNREEKSKRDNQMEKRKKSEKQIEQYEHKDKERADIPPVGLVTPASDPRIPEIKNPINMTRILTRNCSGQEKPNILVLKCPR